MIKVRVIPAQGIRIPDNAMPKGSSSEKVMLPPEGKVVEETIYWLKRERDGDVRIERTSESTPVSAGAKSVKAGE